MIKKTITKVAFATLALLSFTGCMGQMGLTGKVLKFNLTATEDKWNREWIFLGMWIIPVYPISAFLDLLIFNSVEFWSGENPINGKSPLVDVPMSAVAKMGFNKVDGAQIERVDSLNAKLHLEFETGDKATFDVVRNDDQYTVSYEGVEFYNGVIGAN